MHGYVMHSEIVYCSTASVTSRFHTYECVFHGPIVLKSVHRKSCSGIVQMREQYISVSEMVEWEVMSEELR